MSLRHRCLAFLVAVLLALTVFAGPAGAQVEAGPDFENAAATSARGPNGPLFDGDDAWGWRSEGSFSSSSNANGGTVWTSEGRINQNDFADIVYDARQRGDTVDILSGVHGDAAGGWKPDQSLLRADQARFAEPGVTVHDWNALTDAQRRAILGSDGTVIGGFCDSGACVAPFRGG